MTIVREIAQGVSRKNTSGLNKSLPGSSQKHMPHQGRYHWHRLEGALPIIAEVDFEDEDGGDIYSASFLYEFKKAFQEGWSEAIRNPWGLANDRACCNVVLGLLKDSKYDRSALLAWLCPALLSLALSEHGSLIVHKVLDVATGSDFAMIASQFHGSVDKLCRSPTGHLVLSELIGTMPVSMIGFVASELKGKCSVIARHEFGYRVLEAMLMHGSHVQTSTLSVELAGSAIELSRDPYGHNVLRHLLEYGADTWKLLAIHHLRKTSLLQYQGIKSCGAEAFQYDAEYCLRSSGVPCIV
jgi:hypothetical protein